MLHRRNVSGGLLVLGGLFISFCAILPRCALGQGAEFVANDSQTAKPLVAEENIQDIIEAPSDSSTSTVDPAETASSLEAKRIEKIPSGQADLTVREESAVGSSPRPNMLRGVFALFVVLVLIVLCAFLFRKFGLRSRAGLSFRGVEVIARTSIGPKQSLCLVKLGRRLLLLGLSPNHMAPIDAIDDPDEIARIMGNIEGGKRDSISGAFNKIFHRESHSYDRLDEDDDYDSQGDSERHDSAHSSEQWYNARGELSLLLDKVRGLTKIRTKS